MNFYLSIEFTKPLNKNQIKQIQKFERFLFLVIIVDDVLRKERNSIFEFEDFYEKIEKLIKNNVFGLCKKDYNFLFKTIKKFSIYKGLFTTKKIDLIRSLLFVGKLYIITDYIVELKDKYNIIIDYDKTIENLKKIWFD